MIIDSVSSTGGPRKKISPAERTLRIQEGFCCYCGADGNVCLKCPVLRSTKQYQKGNTTSENFSNVLITIVNNETTVIQYQFLS